MKQLFVCLLMVITLSGFAQERTIAAKELPRNAQILIKETFNFQKVIRATMDVDSRETEYQFVLADNTKVECDAEGNWTEIESTNMPTSLIPERVSATYQKNYPDENVKVIKLELEKNHNLKIKLSNGVEMLYKPESGAVYIEK
ncbi:MAG: PepSY-like domain-containing protein [Bacteroidales bacterium]|nr:PepSY-like domain-containing protein [Bacteroidales bacterium]